MYKIILLEPVLAHYQKDVWENMRKSEDFDFRIIAGNDYLGIRSLTGTEYKTFNYSSFKILNHKFYYLRGSCAYIFKENPDAIISSGVDFHHIHTIVIFLFFRIVLRKRFYWWSHGTSGKQGKIGISFRSFFYKLASGTFLYSRKGRDNLTRMGVRAERLRVVGNSMNTIEYGFLNYDILNKSCNEVFTILYCGRINPDKKLDVLIKSLDIISRKHLFDFKCVLVGGGDLSMLKSLSDQLELSDKIEFVGPKYDAEIHPYFLHSDLFVYPGGIGLSLVQAHSFGLPVITTNNFALHGPEIELLQPGTNGDFFADNSYVDLAKKIETWYLKLNEKKVNESGHFFDRIISFGYLPEIVSSNVVSCLNKDFNISDS
jgi:glycosyltransferase involved in cell wall biosynthesis